MDTLLSGGEWTKDTIETTTAKEEGKRRRRRMDNVIGATTLIREIQAGIR